MIDKIEKITMIVFKIGILVIGIVFLMIYYWSSQNGRFHEINNEIIDTQTGIIYSYDKGFLSVNFKTGKIEKYDRQIIDKRKLDLPAAPAALPPEAPPPAPAPAPAPAS
jgi:hypothetical protein